jgi:hypothetical protein
MLHHATGPVFSPGHLFVGGGRLTGEAYEDDIKIKYKQVVGISRTYYLSKETISRPPQSRETIPSNMEDTERKGFLMLRYVMKNTVKKERGAR